MEDDPLDYLARWLLRSLSIAVAGLCLYARGIAGAYLLLLMYPLYIAVCIVHCRLHFRALKPGILLSRALVKQLLLSHVLFTIAFLLQYDYAEGPEWLLVTFLLFGSEKGAYKFTDYSWIADIREGMGIILSVAIFVPYCMSGLRLKKQVAAIDENLSDRT